MTVQNATPYELISTAESVMEEAGEKMDSFAHYSGPAPQFMAEMANVQAMFLAAQSYIALADYKRTHGYA